jgi:hypothetical protein
MSAMQVFYIDLNKTIVSAERKTGAPVKKMEAQTAVSHDTYHEKLARLTRLTLVELNDYWEEMAWSAWW